MGSPSQPIFRVGIFPEKDPLGLEQRFTLPEANKHSTYQVAPDPNKKIIVPNHPFSGANLLLVSGKLSVSSVSSIELMVFEPPVSQKKYYASVLNEML